MWTGDPPRSVVGRWATRRPASVLTSLVGAQSSGAAVVGHPKCQTAAMTSDFPAYDPGPGSSGPGDGQRLTFPSVEAMAAADPYEVAAVLLRATFRFPGSGRVRDDDVIGTDLVMAAERSLRDFSRGLVDSITNRYPPPFRRVLARTLAIWRTALVADTLPAGPNSAQVLVLIEPALIELSDDELSARLRDGLPEPGPTLR